MDPIVKIREYLGKLPPGEVPMVLATADARGRPSARVVLLKDFDGGFVFYTNRESRKGRELRAQPWASLLFFWPALDTQLRVEGPVAEVASELADAYFATRPRGSQLGAWASQQSEALASRAELEARVLELERKYAGKLVPRPPHWVGYRLDPERVEFWHRADSRLHERHLHLRTAAGWTETLLNP